MLKNLLEGVSSLVFPAVCETCHTVLSPFSALGVCVKCESEIKWLAPPFCVSCGRTLKNEVPRCGQCTKGSFHFDRAFACALYEGKMKELIHHYKFGRRKCLKEFFVKAMTNFIGRHLKNDLFDLILAVPIDNEKKAERGFNQSELISNRLACVLKIPDASEEIDRIKSASPQSLLAKMDRKLNVQGRFSSRNKNFFDHKDALLIDDILTTGETASECAKTLKEAGASSVTVLACARGI